MSKYGEELKKAAYKKHGEARFDGSVKFPATTATIVTALRHLLKPSKAMRNALKDAPWTEGRLEVWRAGIKAAIKEIK